MAISDPTPRTGGDPATTLPSLYRAMRRIRRFEEVAHEQFAAGNIPGPLHLSIGQEAVAAGVGAWLRQDDAILSTHRGHHHVLAKGARTDRLMAELLGRSDGYSRGRGGSMHVAVPALGILGTNGIVGGGLPISTGAAYGMLVQGRDAVTVCFFGEGAAATGAFGEALNIAGLWKLPLVFVCENNQYVELTPQRLHVAGDGIWTRAAGYGMPGVLVDGNDAGLVAQAGGEAIARARRGDGPTLMEATTYRWFGHYAGDKAGYRDGGEVVEWREERDPLKRARAELGVAADDIEAVVESEIQEALAFALASPAAGVDSLYLDASEAP